MKVYLLIHEPFNFLKVLKLGEVLEALAYNASKEDTSDRYRSKGEHVHQKLEELHKKNEDESGYCGRNRRKSISSPVNNKLRNKRVHSEIENENTCDDDDESLLSPTAETLTVNEPVPNLDREIHRLPRNQVNLRAKRSQSQRKSRRITRRPPYLADDDAFFNVTARKYCSQNVQQEESNKSSSSLVANQRRNIYSRLLTRNQVYLRGKRSQSQRKSRRITRRPPYLADDDSFFNVTAREYSSKAVEQVESNKGGKDLRSRSLVTNKKRLIRSTLPRKQVMLGSKRFQSQRKSRRTIRRPPCLADVSARKYASKAVEQEESNKGGKDLRSRSLVMNTWRIDPSVYSMLRESRALL